MIGLGTAPPSTLQVDTRTGVAVEGTTDGRIGLELGIEIDSGSVDATVSYLATLDIPDTTNLDKADPINFNPNSVLAGTNTLNEPRRVYRRLQLLRGLEHEQIKSIFPRG